MSLFRIVCNLNFRKIDVEVFCLKKNKIGKARRMARMLENPSEQSEATLTEFEIKSGRFRLRRVSG